MYASRRLFLMAGLNDSKSVDLAWLVASVSNRFGDGACYLGRRAGLVGQFLRASSQTIWNEGEWALRSLCRYLRCRPCKVAWAQVKNNCAKATSCSYRTFDRVRCGGTRPGRVRCNHGTCCRVHRVHIYNRAFSIGSPVCTLG